MLERDAFGEMKGSQVKNPSCFGGKCEGGFYQARQKFQGYALIRQPNLF